MSNVNWEISIEWQVENPQKEIENAEEIN